MTLFLFCPFAFGLGWFSHYSVMIDRGLIGAVLLVFGFTPLFSSGISAIERAPEFHNRDFIGPWIWLFDQASGIAQFALLVIVCCYFLGKIGSWLYLIGWSNPN